MNAITTPVITSFDDTAVRPESWSSLLDQGDTRTGILDLAVSATLVAGESRTGRLLLILRHATARPKAIAPLFVASGMVMNLCPVNTLDMIGDVTDPELLDSILLAAAGYVDGFVGLRFHYIPDTSRTGRFLKESADRLGWKCYLEDELPSPIMDLRGKRRSRSRLHTQENDDTAREPIATRGSFEVHHFRDAGDVLPQLDESSINMSIAGPILKRPTGSRCSNGNHFVDEPKSLPTPVGFAFHVSIGKVSRSRITVAVVTKVTTNTVELPMRQRLPSIHPVRYC